MDRDRAPINAAEEKMELASGSNKRRGRARPKRGDVDPAVTRCMAAFYEHYVRAMNPPKYAELWIAAKQENPRAEPFPKSHIILPQLVGGRDGAYFKRMLTAWGEERVLALIDEFFRRWTFRDPLVIRTNMYVPDFNYIAPKLLTRLPAIDARAAATVEAAQRAVEWRRSE